MTYSEAIESLKMGLVVRRLSNLDIIILMQVPSDIPESVIPKMSSLNDMAKKVLADNNIKELKYKNQFLQVNLKTGDATTYIPSTEDIFAKDYVVVV